MPFVDDTPIMLTPPGLPAQVQGGDIDMRYTTPLIVALIHHRRRNNRTLGVLAHPFSYTHAKLNKTITADAFFETDFASVPTFARGLITPVGRHAKAAVLHDWLYADGAPGGRDHADRVFCMALAELGVPAVVRLVMYLSVRLFAARAYGRPDGWAFADPRTGLPIDPPRPSAAETAASANPERSRSVVRE